MEIEEKEYERLLRIENGEPKLCEGPNCPFWKEADRKKWSWGHFWVGLSKDVKHLFTAFINHDIASSSRISIFVIGKVPTGKIDVH